MKPYNPVSTYRIQFHKDFNFDDFEIIIPYLHKLGIKTVYASPIFEASPGSLHGYNGVNPNNINPEIGTYEQLLKISARLKELNIEWLQDIVPNHLSFDEHNPWIMDVLIKGEKSEYASYFDIDWNHPKHKGKLMVPFPGSELEKILKANHPEARHFVICDWKETNHTINYRRFFTVNSLICTNIQHPEVFENYHRLTKTLVEKKVFSGLRIDHVDGLYDPKKYLQDLRRISGENTYIIVEKILEPGENIPADWPIQGSSGYDFLGMVNNLFTNRLSEYDLTAFYFDTTGDGTPVEDQVTEKKKLILFQYMHGELDNLVRLYKSLNPVNVDDDDLRNAIADYLIECPVYRYYDDDFKMMTIDLPQDKEKLRPFYTRCMQFTGPLMAKGVEDTLMYTYNRFIGHNEVGDMPTTFGYSIEEFHELMKYRQSNWPLASNATSTHDTKRGEDARARLNAITDIHEDWINTVKSWMKENEDLKTNGMPDKNDEYFIYQTLVATFSEEETYRDRIKEYLYKALREAKVHSDWGEPNSEYENAAINFAHSVIDRKRFLPILERITDIGIKKSLGQLVLKFTCPGVPDIYQGTELWDLSMVDPDNRRPVDYEIRNELLTDPTHIKFSLLQKMLKIRNNHAELFAEGEYIPVSVEGKYKNNLIAFLRQHNNASILTLVQVIHTNTEWADTRIIFPSAFSSTWEDLLNNEKIDINSQKFLPGSIPAIYRSC